MFDEHMRPARGADPPEAILRFDITMTWDEVTLRTPFHVLVSPRGEVEAAHLRWKTFPYMSHEDSPNMRLIFDDLKRCVETLKLVGDYEGLDGIERRLQERVLPFVRAHRSRGAHNLMTFKSLVPDLPRGQEQELSMLHTQMPYGTYIRVQHDGMYHNAVINSYSGMHARDVARFVSKVPAVRWDKLDYVLDSCHLRPSMTVEERR